MRKFSLFMLSVPLCAMLFASCTQDVDKTARVPLDFYKLGFDFGNNLADVRQRGQQLDQDALLRGIKDALAGAKLGQEQTQTFLTALSQLLATPQPRDTVAPARGKGFIDDYAKLNAKRQGVVTTTSGVQYEVLKKGSGQQPKATDTVMVQYQGSLTNGTVFDGTYEDGKPAPMKIDEVAVPGLKEALLLMHPGDKWRVVIPPNMGFVNFGNNRLRRRDLIYEIELLAVNPAK